MKIHWQMSWRGKNTEAQRLFGGCWVSLVQIEEDLKQAGESRNRKINMATRYMSEKQTNKHISSSF